MPDNMSFLSINVAPKPFLSIRDEAFQKMADYFVDGILPEVGDRIEMVCTARTEKTMEVQLRTVKND